MKKALIINWNDWLKDESIKLDNPYTAFSTEILIINKKEKGEGHIRIGPGLKLFFYMREADKERLEFELTREEYETMHRDYCTEFSNRRKKILNHEK